MNNSSVSGADPEDLLVLARKMDSGAHTLESATAAVSAQLGAAPWRGPVADRFRADWNTRYRQSLASAAQFLHEAQEILARNRQEQLQASGVSGSSSAGGGTWRSPDVPAVTPFALLTAVGLIGRKWLESPISTMTAASLFAADVGPRVVGSGFGKKALAQLGSMGKIAQSPSVLGAAARYSAVLGPVSAALTLPGRVDQVVTATRSGDSHAAMVGATEAAADTFKMAGTKNLQLYGSGVVLQLWAEASKAAVTAAEKGSFSPEGMQQLHDALSHPEQINLGEVGKEVGLGLVGPLIRSAI